MATKELPHPTEAEIQDKCFKEFLRWRHQDSLRVTNWRGWSQRTNRNHSRVSHFYREYDIAVFYKESDQLMLNGYEVKGWSKIRNEKLIEPPFGEGIDQALALLLQGADFTYAIYPQPKKVEDQVDLKKLCDQFAPYVGLIYVQNDLSMHTTAREPQRNPHSTPDRKKKMLASLVAGGVFSEMSDQPSWVKQQQY